MSSYPPPAGTYQPQQPSTMRPEANRVRTNSATAERYRPRGYSNPPPAQPDPTLLGPHQQSYAPPNPNTYPPQLPPQPPYPHPEDTTYPATRAPIAMPQPEPSYPNLPTSVLAPSARHSSYGHSRPPLDDYEDSGRRHSYSSQLSRHSHESRQSRDSKRSRHSRYSVDENGHERKSHRSKKEHPNRTNERPTMGDSLVSVFGLIKSALGPRDKA